jgi:hypothetical protein
MYANSFGQFTLFKERTAQEGIRLRKRHSNEQPGKNFDLEACKHLGRIFYCVIFPFLYVIISFVYTINQIFFASGKEQNSGEHWFFSFPAQDRR